MSETEKKSLFEQADIAYIEAREYYDIGKTDIAADFENRFKMILEKMIRFGVDREYFGIA